MEHSLIDAAILLDGSTIKTRRERKSHNPIKKYKLQLDLSEKGNNNCYKSPSF